MAKVKIPGGFRYPFWDQSPSLFLGSSEAADATGERFAMIGRVYWDGEPTSPKTISAAGGGSVSFRHGASVFSNVASILDIGIQDVDGSNGPYGRPDGTFDVKRTLNGTGSNIFAQNAFNTTSMSGGSGSKSIANGDLIAIVVDFVDRQGSDTIIHTPTGLKTPLALCNRYLAGAWGNSGPVGPNCYITADDGTIGIFRGQIPVAAVGTGELFNSATNPFERGMKFRPQMDCSAIGLWVYTTAAAVTRWDFELIQDPLGTPAVIGGPIDVNQVQAISSAGFFDVLFPAPVALSKSIDYGVILRMTDTDNIQLHNSVLPSAAMRALMPAGTSLEKITRNGGSGAFTSASTVIMYHMGVLISEVHDGAGGAGGGQQVYSGGM